MPKQQTARAKGAKKARNWKPSDAHIKANKARRIYRADKRVERAAKEKPARLTARQLRRAKARALAITLEQARNRVAPLEMRCSGEMLVKEVAHLIKRPT